MQPGGFCGANVEQHAVGDVGAGDVQEGAQVTRTRPDRFLHIQLSLASENSQSLLSHSSCFNINLRQRQKELNINNDVICLPGTSALPLVAHKLYSLPGV